MRLPRQGPLVSSYTGAVLLVVFSLVPFLMLTAAVFSLIPMISRSTGLSKSQLDLAIVMSDAGYAFGTVLAVQFAVHLPARRMLLIYVSAFVAAATLAASAPNGPVFFAAFVVEGLCTSLMLIAAVPPLVTGWPVTKMPVTGTIMNLCIFGAVAVGPTVGGAMAAWGHWRPLFWAVAGMAGMALLFALLTYEDVPPMDPGAPWDFVAVALAAGGTGASFFGAGKLQDGGVAPVSLVPLLAGMAMIVALVAHQYHSKQPLMPVRQLATMFPVSGILTALFASAAAFGLMELVILTLQKTSTPGRTALLFLPEFGAALLTAVLFGFLFRTRFTPLLAISGLLMLTAAAALLTGLAAGQDAIVAAGSGLIGLGVGASVSPSLFITGFTLRSSQLQRVFALIELLRGVTAFLIAPILIYLSTVLGTSSAAGIRGAIWVCLGIAAAGTLVVTALFTLSGGRLQTPDLERWTSGGEPAWESPPLLSRVRGRRDAEARANGRVRT